MENLLEQQLRDQGYTGQFNLESLIEACGDRFKFIEIQNYNINQPKWTALDSEGVHRTFGSTPLEAVANLWLKLNKNV